MGNVTEICKDVTRTTNFGQVLSEAAGTVPYGRAVKVILTAPETGRSLTLYAVRPGKMRRLVVSQPVIRYGAQWWKFGSYGKGGDYYFDSTEPEALLIERGMARETGFILTEVQAETSRE